MRNRTAQVRRPAIGDTAHWGSHGGDAEVAVLDVLVPPLTRARLDVFSGGSLIGNYREIARDRLVPTIEDLRFSVADRAEQLAETGDRIARTLESMGAHGDTESRARRLALAERIREVSEHWSREADRWRSIAGDS